MIRYDRLWDTMANRGMTQYKLIKFHGFSAGQIGRLKKNMHVSTHTLETLCRLLDCRIEDIVEYTADEPAEASPETMCPADSEAQPAASDRQIQQVSSDNPALAAAADSQIPSDLSAPQPQSPVPDAAAAITDASAQPQDCELPPADQPLKPGKTKKGSKAKKASKKSLKNAKKSRKK